MFVRQFLPVILLFLHFLCKAQSIDQQKAYYKAKVEKYLDKEKALGTHYTINDSGIYIYAEPIGRIIPIDYFIPWSEINTLKKTIGCYPDDSLLMWLKEPNRLKQLDCNKKGSEVDANKKLSGVKIALDPGHIAGDLKNGILEKKSLHFKYNNKNIEIVEGLLTLQTALILKKMLEEQGAEVMLTRSEPNQTAFGITYHEWLGSHFKNSVDTSFANGEITEKEKTFLLTKATERDIFRTYFNNLDMKERVRKINAFSPDLTIVIHYNVDETNTGWTKPTIKNFNMVLVGGSFLKNELEKPIDRLAFLRMLVTDDLEQSVKLSGNLISTFTNKLNVPAATVRDAEYLTKYCMPADVKGVYSRNLTLTRLVKGTVVYGETLYQDNAKECLLLSNPDTEVYGIKTSSRVKQVAEAYYEGIMSYCNSK